MVSSPNSALIRENNPGVSCWVGRISLDLVRANLDDPHPKRLLRHSGGRRARRRSLDHTMTSAALDQHRAGPAEDQHRERIRARVVPRPGSASRASRIPARTGNRRGIWWWKALSTAKMALTGGWVALPTFPGCRCGSSRAFHLE
jgi:hypothetical protein